MNCRNSSTTSSSSIPAGLAVADLTVQVQAPVHATQVPVGLVAASAPSDHVDRNR